jgi:hypothetical protein
MEMSAEGQQGAGGEGLPFELSVRRVGTRDWGCGSAEVDYAKMYKVGQGSYGFEWWFQI